MSRRVDLNAPRNSENDYKKSRNNHSFYHANMTNNNLNEDMPDNANTNTGKNKGNMKDSLQQKATSIGLQALGVPRFAAKLASNYATDDKVKAVVKFPKKAKIVLTALIVAIPIVALMLFVTLFSSAEATGAASYIAIAETCSKVTVTNTDCDENGSNCNKTYDAEVGFDDYVAGVVAGIGDGANNAEFYKALSIVVRTYFFANADSSCQVEGNSTFMEYKDINVATDSSMIKSAVSETNKIVLTDDNDSILNLDYGMACVVNDDGTDYYVRYGIDTTSYQKIPISFDRSDHLYRGKLSSLYNVVNTSTDYENRACPGNNNGNDLSLVGAFYLAKNEGYSYQQIINYYYGKVNEAKAEPTFSGNAVDGFINPVNPFPYCTSSFGCRIHPISGGYRYHNGIDIPVVEGTLVYATKAGKISAIRKDVTGYLAGSYGNYVDIDHMDGTLTRYAHLKYGGIALQVGMMVKQGQVIALSGNTGGSTGPHLHYEVHENGRPVDPYNYIDTTVISNPGSCNYGQSVDARYCGR